LRSTLSGDDADEGVKTASGLGMILGKPSK